MIIWRYRVPVSDGAGGTAIRRAYGFPVTVTVPGVGDVRAVYQFQGGEDGQRCAVVHHPSGRVIAPVTDAHTGWPQERAQQAVDERLRKIPFPADVWRAETLNHIGAVV